MLDNVYSMSVEENKKIVNSKTNKCVQINSKTWNYLYTKITFFSTTRVMTLITSWWKSHVSAHHLWSLCTMLQPCRENRVWSAPRPGIFMYYIVICTLKFIDCKTTFKGSLNRYTRVCSPMVASNCTWNLN